MKVVAVRNVYIFDSWGFRQLNECQVQTFNNHGDCSPEFTGTWEDLRSKIFMAANEDTRYHFLVGWSSDNNKPQWDRVR